MRKLAIATLLVLCAALSVSASAANPNPVFVGTWIVSQTVSLPSGPPIPTEVLTIPEFMHVDPGNEIRVLSGLFHPTSRGTSWSMGPFRDLSVPVNGGTGIGDWSWGENGEAVFSYHAFLYGSSNKPIGYVHVVRTLDAAVGWLATADEDGDDVLTGSTTLRFFDLAGKPLSLQMGPMGTRTTGLTGPFRAVRAATAD